MTYWTLSQNSPSWYHDNDEDPDQVPGQCSQCVTVINVRSSPGHTLQVCNMHIMATVRMILSKTMKTMAVLFL